jgi:hypothetical protein
MCGSEVFGEELSAWGETESAEQRERLSQPNKGCPDHVSLIN